MFCILGNPPFGGCGTDSFLKLSRGFLLSVSSPSDSSNFIQGCGFAAGFFEAEGFEAGGFGLFIAFLFGESFREPVAGGFDGGEVGETLFLQRSAAQDRGAQPCAVGRAGFFVFTGGLLLSCH